MEMPIKELRYWLRQASDICSKRDACVGCPFRFYRLLRDRRGETGALAARSDRRCSGCW